MNCLTDSSSQKFKTPSYCDRVTLMVINRPSAGRLELRSCGKLERNMPSIDRDTRYAHRFLLKEHIGKTEGGITFRWNSGK